MIIVSALALTAGALFFVLFVRTRDVPEPIPVSPTQHLEDRKGAIYDNLRDLQFEYRLGKLSDDDYRQTKLALQRELAVVLAEMDGALKRSAITVTRGPAKASSSKKISGTGTTCPFCGAQFPQPLKFCGECGKAMT